MPRVGQWVEAMESAAGKQERQEPAVALDPGIRRELGAGLRALYGGIDREPIPGRHIDLLLELRHKERNRRRAGGA